MSPSPVVAVAHHGITVADLDVSVAFFRDVFGLRERMRVNLDEEFSNGVTGIDGALISVAFLEAPGLDIELLQYHGPKDRGRVTARPCDAGAAHLALYVEDVDSLVQAASQHGWSLAGAVQPITTGPRRGGRAAYLSNADGAVLELVQRP